MRSFKHRFLLFAGSACLGLALLWMLNNGPSRTRVLSDPDYLYLTVPPAVHTSMAVHFQTGQSGGVMRVYYDVVSRVGAPDSYAFSVQALGRAIPGLEGKRLVHTALLEGLEPGRVVYFVVGSAETGFSAERHFRAIPDTGPLCAIVGGDMGDYPETKTLLRLAASYDPHFAVIGGDIAYANGDPGNLYRWDGWFNNWDALMRDSEGNLIPIVATVGNHDVNDDVSRDDPERRAPFYMSFFGRQDDRIYFARRFAQGAAFYLLDSNHLVSHEAQVPWLREAMAADQAIPLKFPVYHKPIYPATRDFDGEGAALGQQFWAPVFDEFGATAAFEHHGHIFKRTQPLRAGVYDESGTLYHGEGCFGIEPRDLGDERAAYAVNVESRRYFTVLEISESRLSLLAVDEEGDVFDAYTRDRMPALVAAACD